MPEENIFQKYWRELQTKSQQLSRDYTEKINLEQYKKTQEFNKMKEWLGQKLLGFKNKVNSKERAKFGPVILTLNGTQVVKNGGNIKNFI